MVDIVVEDGSGVAGANSYISAADAETYSTDTGRDWSSLTDPEQAMYRAFLQMGVRYRQHWKGTRVELGQATDWPREDVKIDGDDFDDDEVPAEAGLAQIEVLWLMQTDVSPVGATVSEQAGNVKRKKVGPLETEYFAGSSVSETSGVPILPYVDALLAPYLKSAPSGVHMIEARVGLTDDELTLIERRRQKKIKEDGYLW